MIERKQVESTIGKTFADSLDVVVMDVSEQFTFTKREMIEDLGCGNFIAAARLGKVLKRLNIYTPAKLFRTDPFSLLRTRGIGATCIFVAMSILDHAQYNVMDWWQYKQEKDNVVKFSAYKHRATRRASKHKQEVA